MNTPLPSELESLHAYVDGQLSPEARRQYEVWLADHPETRRQAEDYRRLKQGMQQLYAPILDEAIPARLLRQGEPRRGWRGFRMAAAAVVLLATGVVIGRITLPIAPPGQTMTADVAGVVRDAAMAYAVYTPEVKHPVEVPATQEKHLVGWLSKRMGTAIEAPNLESVGYSLVGGRLMATSDGPGALLMYEDRDGQRVVLYASANTPGDHATAFRFAREDRVSVFYWVDEPLSYALAGELQRSDLLKIAESVYRQLGA